VLQVRAAARWPIHIVYQSSRLLSKVRTFIDLVTEISTGILAGRKLNQSSFPGCAMQSADAPLWRSRKIHYPIVVTGTGFARFASRPGMDDYCFRHHAERSVGARDHDVVGLDKNFVRRDRDAGLDHVCFPPGAMPDRGALMKSIDILTVTSE